MILMTVTEIMEEVHNNPAIIPIKVYKCEKRGQEKL